ncbi:MAG: tRNA-specific 2-thiouridylase, partial [Victivallaceae bacterium]
DYARSIGATGIITGHYANLVRNLAGHNELHHAKDSAKDQIYFLALLNQKQLDFCHMPLGGMCKSEVRAKAEALGLANAKKRESQDACFGIPGEAFSHTLKKYFNENTPGGNIVDTQGKILGFHPGIYLYTVGQRKGLNVAMGVPAYVSEIRPASNEVVLTTNADDLLIDEVELHDMNLLDEFQDGLQCMVQLRYRQAPLATRIYHLPEVGQLLIRLDKAISRPALGQVGAIYVDDRLLGGGIISRLARSN